MLERSCYFFKVYSYLFFPVLFLFIGLSRLHGEQLINGSGLIYMLPILCVLPATNYVQIMVIPLAFTMPSFVLEGIPYMLEMLLFFTLWLALTKLPEKQTLIGYILFTVLCFVIDGSDPSYFWIMMGLLWGFSLSDYFFRAKNGLMIVGVGTDKGLSFPSLLHRTTYKLIGLCFLIPTGIYYLRKKKLIWEELSQSQVIIFDKFSKVKVSKRSFTESLLRLLKICLSLVILSTVLQTAVIMFVFMTSVLFGFVG